MSPSTSRKTHPPPVQAEGATLRCRGAGVLVLFVLSPPPALTVAGSESAEPAEAGQIKSQVGSRIVSVSTGRAVKRARGTGFIATGTTSRS